MKIKVTNVWLIMGCLVLLILGISLFFILGKKEVLPSASNVAPQSKAKKEYTLGSLLEFEPADAQWDFKALKVLILTLAWKDPFFTTKGGRLARYKLIEFANSDGFDEHVLAVAEGALRYENGKQNKHARVWLALLNVYGLTENGDEKQESIRTIKLMAEQNEPLALYILALNSTYGMNGFSKEPDKVLGYYERSYKHGGSWGALGLGEVYINGKDVLGLKSDAKKAMEYFEQAYAMNSLSSLRALSQNYFYNDDVMNRELSSKYSEELCSMDIKYGAFGCSTLAFILANEIQTSGFENKKLINEFVTVAKKGWNKDKSSPESAAALAIAYSLFPTEFRVGRDEIRIWGQRACPKRDPDFEILNGIVGKACANLADIYTENKATSVITDIEAIEYYRRAMREGIPRAYGNLAQMFRAGTDNVKQNIKLFYELHTIAIEKFNHPYSIYNLALAYSNGVYVEKDYGKTIELLKRAALLGHLGAVEDYARSLFLFLDAPDYKQCYVWGSVAKKRQYSDARAADDCAKKLSESERAHLQPAIVQLDRQIKR